MLIGFLIAAVMFVLAEVGCATHTALEPQRPTPPPDQPVTFSEMSAWDELIRLMEPFVQQARATYPDAKRRFLQGLPQNHLFSITTRLVDDDGRVEQVFIEVTSIEDGIVTGLIASDVNVVTGFEPWQEYRFPETELVDWTILRPDGSEEGNYVGKFLDEWQASGK